MPYGKAYGDIPLPPDIGKDKKQHTIVAMILCVCFVLQQKEAYRGDTAPVLTQIIWITAAYKIFLVWKHLACFNFQLVKNKHIFGEHMWC